MLDPWPRSLVAALLLLVGAAAAAGGCQLNLDGTPCPCTSAYHCCAGMICRLSCTPPGDGGPIVVDPTDAIGDGMDAWDPMDATDAADADVPRAPLSPGWVACGERSSCALEAEGPCCYDPRDGMSACDSSAGRTCANATLPSQPATLLRCDSQDDCGGSYVCCFFYDYTRSETACVQAADCVADPYGPTMKMAVCPLADGGGCPHGCESTSVVFPSPATPLLPPYLYLCAP